ncbi:carbohydrate porin [Teichococcus oryzae]|uniref:Carbohydrate porin n=1 Tax=Teichococcus oryzae TaxID=1608942 RepID=A0A5B2TCM3_9PROT|nr:carbohydrate porin [Pseudoroseomonas oryzae]KAA2211825.1 carbohydrate porin [Pseudoroseomonas oryzae]
MIGRIEGMGRVLLLLGALGAALPAWAQEAPDPEEACGEGTRLLRGLCVSTSFTFDGFGNLRGGLRRGVAGTAQIGLGVQVDFGRIAGLDGWTLGANALGIWGRQAGEALTGSLASPSNIEALSTVRLYEIWLQREVEGWGSLRFGQLSAESDFTVADAAEKLVADTFGWPVALGEALPSGGPEYPLAAPGIRLALGEPRDGHGLSLGLFSGDPGGRYGENTDPERHNRHGINFSTAGGAFMMAEAVIGATRPPEGPRPWVVKLGAWHHTGGFDAQRRDAEGLSLADPASSGEPRRYRNNQGGYAVGEATLWREGAQSLAVFARGFAQPADRNPVSLQLDGGLAWTAPFRHVGHMLSFGASHARIGRDARGLDRDAQILADPFRPRRTHETVLEVNYDFPVGPVHLRPLAQWYINPAANAADEETGRSLRDALLLGLRIQATF